ncbi:hypothetical protein TWF694_005485 [Orbilia ellipsospora]|uniref:Uncharacterized protein n=1 Tax=Orbilia ellipsospora TaxID=2528407 RepID=A0AAV9WTB1_9PEZI
MDNNSHDENLDPEGIAIHSCHVKQDYEILGDTAALAAFHEFEQHQREQGRVVSHALAKAMLATFAVVKAEKLVGMCDMSDCEEYRKKTKEKARQRSGEMYRDRYESQK